MGTVARHRLEVTFPGTVQVEGSIGKMADGEVANGLDMGTSEVQSRLY